MGQEVVGADGVTVVIIRAREEEPCLGRVLLVGVPGATGTQTTILHVIKHTQHQMKAFTAIITRNLEVNVMCVVT